LKKQNLKQQQLNNKQKGRHRVPTPNCQIRSHSRATQHLQPETGKFEPGERVDADTQGTDWVGQGFLHDRVLVGGAGKDLKIKYTQIMV